MEPDFDIDEPCDNEKCSWCRPNSYQACVMAGWNEGPNPGWPEMPFLCELADMHEGPHAAFTGTNEDQITW
jgi:hypothetical protein